MQGVIVDLKHNRSLVITGVYSLTFTCSFPLKFTTLYVSLALRIYMLIFILLFFEGDAAHSHTNVAAETLPGQVWDKQLAMKALRTLNVSY